MPRTLIDDGTLREVYHYRPGRAGPRAGRPGPAGDPARRARRSATTCAAAARWSSTSSTPVGRRTSWSTARSRSRTATSAWSTGSRRSSRRRSARCPSTPAAGRCTWSAGRLGGIFALLAAADDPDLPIASITAVGAPFDVRQVPLVAPLRPLLNFTDGRGAITRLYQAAGGAPQPLVRWAFQLSSFQKLVTKPLAIARNLDDADYLAQIEAVDRFTANMIAYPGRTLRPALPPAAQGQRPGRRHLRGRRPRPSRVGDITAPVLVFAGAADGIAPVASVQGVGAAADRRAEVRFEIVPGGHLGMLTGRKARSSTWLVLDEWIDQWSEPEQPAAPGASYDEEAAATRKAAAKRRRHEGAGEEGARQEGAPRRRPPRRPREVRRRRTRRAGDRGRRDRDQPDAVATGRPAPAPSAAESTIGCA